MRRNIRTVLVAALVITIAGAALVYAERGNGDRGAEGRFGDRLTEEQREAVHAMVLEMREAGASREDIHAAVREMLESYGVAVPDCPPEGRPEGGPKGNGPGGPFGDRLTEEQREAVHAMVEEMREAGASREDIHAAVREMLESYGIDVPEDFPAGPPGRHGPGGPFGDRLTEEQRQAIHAAVMEMREAGASREDIHAAVGDMLAEFGIEPPECPEGSESSSQAENLGESPGEGKRWGEIKGRFE